MGEGTGKKVTAVVAIVVIALIFLEASREDSVIGAVYWGVVGGVLGGMGISQAITLPILVLLLVGFGILAYRLLRDRRSV